MLRRTFLGLLGAAGMSAAVGQTAQAAGTKHFQGHPGSKGVLFDATRCIGCRSCEAGCNQVNGLPAPAKPFDDLSVLDHPRRLRRHHLYHRQPLRPNLWGRQPGLPQEPVPALSRTGLRFRLFRSRPLRKPRRER